MIRTDPLLKTAAIMTNYCASHALARCRKAAPAPLPSGVRRGRAACRLPDLLASGPSRRFGSLSRSQIAPLSREPSLLVSSLKHILSRFLCASLSPVSLVLTKGLSLLCNLRVRQFWDSGFLLVIRVVSALV